jgi:hypothetical protein
MSEKSTFHETKEVVSRFRETIEITIKPYNVNTAKSQINGHQIYVKLNMSPEDVDGMNEPDGPLYQAISNAIEAIKGPMKSEYLGVIKTEDT